MVVDDVTKLFEYCADQDWQCSETPSKNNLSFKVLQSIMEYYIQNVTIVAITITITVTVNVTITVTVTVTLTVTVKVTVKL